MIISYKIPETFEREIDELESLIQQYKDNTISESALKAHRVPFGVYEQRTPHTYMVRIRCAGGIVTPAQLRTIAHLSEKYGGDSVHITTRQELQIHDVALDNVITIMRELLPVGLSSRGGGGNTVRNIMASWDSGIAIDEVFDVTPYAVALTSRLISESDSWILPRKFKISFANSSKDNANATFNDVGFIAAKKNGELGFKVYTAGGLGRKPHVGHLLHDFVSVDDVYIVAEAIKKMFNHNGNRKNKHAARLRFLWNSLGRDKFVELYDQEYSRLQKEPVAPLPITPIKNKMHEDVEIKPVQEASHGFDIWKERYVKEQKQPGLYSIQIPILLGRLKNEHAILLADFLSNFGENVLRCTMSQNLTIRNISEQYLVNVYQIIKSISDLSEQPSVIGNTVACAGASTCKLGICLSQGALLAITKRLRESNGALDSLSPFTLRLSGCSNTCGHHMVADLGFYGKGVRKGQTSYPAYTIVAGAVITEGKARLAEKVDEINAHDLPDFVSKFLEVYLSKQQQYDSFAAYIDDCGEEDIRIICDRYRDIPDFEKDKNYYFDWGAQDVFSIADRGTGECSAGLFDLIELDLELIKKKQHELEVLQDESALADALYHMTLAASRMLLITRGVEAYSDEEVFDQFVCHFIRTDLIHIKFLIVIEAAKAKRYDSLVRLLKEVYALADSVEKLYNSMDNSLRFPTEQSANLDTSRESVVDKSTTDKAHVFKDYRGVACPMNFVKTKMDLANMQKGQLLEILLDDGEPIENVPRSAAEEGHGPNMFYENVEDRKKCCYIRKVKPLKKALSDADVWITGLRREQSGTRNDIQLFSYSAGHDVYKICPLTNWLERNIWEYIRNNDVPYNKLYDKGYSTIGCAPCCRPIGRAEDVRSGRWWWEKDEQKECGIHVENGEIKPSGDLLSWNI